MPWQIREDPLESPAVLALLHKHLDTLAPTAPPESRHALDLNGLRAPEVTFWSIWDGPELAGFGALKELSPDHGEVKSMRTARAYLRQGVASAILRHIIDEARRRGYTRLSLETGAMAFFAPAQQLYRSFGFILCEPFGSYKPDPNSVFMTTFLMTQPPSNSIHPPTLAAWRAWLAANHPRPDGIWLITYRPATGKATFTYEQAVEEALCFGWIDGHNKVLDEERGMQWYAPRRAGSVWAKSNKERVARLIADGRMTPAGLAKIEAAKADGTWALWDRVDSLEVPDDLAAALDAYPVARANFDAFPRSARHAILGWIATAKRPETRARRVAEAARLAQDNIRANQPRR